jgi:uncharacterized protein YlzI (FlbEa/FlbD family)
MRLEHFTTSKGAKVYVNPEYVSLVESEGDATVIRTSGVATTVKGSLDDVVKRLEGEESRFPH